MPPNISKGSMSPASSSSSSSSSSFSSSSASSSFASSSSSSFSSSSSLGADGAATAATEAAAFGAGGAALAPSVGKSSADPSAALARFSSGLGAPQVPIGSLLLFGAAAASPPSVGKSSAELLNSSAFRLPLTAATDGAGASPAAAELATAAPDALLPPLLPSRSATMASALATVSSSPLNSKQGGSSRTVACTPVASRRLRRLEPLLPMTRRT
mmetsp:Transcript_66170/g.141603  ORF Transcript_66170/g.141603 Transcript_66170/m.141603 type:complete len:214 (-) Transcript_66170:1714-2355(-)